ncbi:hypothetical protein [Halomarina oriensis]|uniref:Uncharacterized protein n=1 Tax=Halomarina oriensis TaxID=671145 RepID=A0A6B0GSF1_9EURY|nr:hypothetical protein [Halomarina oriensis]MWG34608.1 hypothetical protein [Halomarina oriensis]
MLAPLRRTLRERLDRRSVGMAVLVVLVLAWITDQNPGNVLLTTLLSAVLVGGSEVVADAYDLRGEIQSVASGLFVTVSGVALALLDSGDAGVAMGVLFAVGGAWMLFDGVQTLRHEGVRRPDSTPADGDEVYRQYLARRVRERLRDRPHTRRELRETFEETPEAVDDALDHLRERDLVVREGSAFVPVERSDPGPVRRALGRLARPVTLELDDGEATPADHTTTDGAVDRAGSSPSGERSSRAVERSR